MGIVLLPKQLGIRSVFAALVNGLFEFKGVHLAALSGGHSRRKTGFGIPNLKGFQGDLLGNCMRSFYKILAL